MKEKVRFESAVGVRRLLGSGLGLGLGLEIGSDELVTSKSN